MEIKTLPPPTVTCFGLIIDEPKKKVGEIPSPIISIVLIHNKADEPNEDGSHGKPAGWGLPGGGKDDKRDKDCLAAAIFEVEEEAGIVAELATRFPTEYGEVLRVQKPYCNNTVLIFHLAKVGDGGRIEYKETGSRSICSLADILLMSLAVNKKTGKIEPFGIYFSHRKYIFIALGRMGIDFMKAIPDLPELLEKRSEEELRAEWGDEVYDILANAVLENDIRVAESGNPCCETDVYVIGEEYFAPPIGTDEIILKKGGADNTDWRIWAEANFPS